MVKACVDILTDYKRVSYFGPWVGRLKYNSVLASLDLFILSMDGDREKYIR